MDEFIVSRDLKYLQLGNRIVDINTGVHTDIESPNPIFVCEMFKTQFLFSHKNNLMESTDLFKKMKELIYPMMDGNSNYIMEYEVRYGQHLIFESEDRLRTEQIISESWEFVKNKIYESNPIIIEGLWDDIKSTASSAWNSTKEFAGKVWDGTKELAGKAWEGIKDAGRWILNKGLPWFFDKLEAFLMHPVGIAVDVALTAIGVGKVVTAVLWGALLIWKVYKLLSGKSDAKSVWTYIDLLVCVVGVAFSGAAKALSSGFKVAGGAIAKLPKALLKTVSNVFGKGAKGIFNLMMKPIEWLGSVFGSGASKMIQSFKSGFNGIFDDMAKMFAGPATKAASGPSLASRAKSALKADVVTPWKAATTGQKLSAAGKGLTYGLAFKGAEVGIHNAMDAYVSSRNKEQEAQMAQVAQAMDDNTIVTAIDGDPELEAALAQMRQS